MIRRPSTQDITWLLDQHRYGQLDLEPPYQRRSVWTRNDKQFFLDTIFRNYPSPAIFLNKTISPDGKATYHVVDGKQRTQTILDFVADKIALAANFGDARLDGKKWSEIAEPDLKQTFWNYQITIEQIDFTEGSIVKEVFDRLNRNARKLTRQELRHAKYEGWLISQSEIEANREEWTKLGVVTKARGKRMVDVQFLSELWLVVLEGKQIGFDQDVLDELYAKYDDLTESAGELDEDALRARFDAVKSTVLAMEETNHVITELGRGFANFYSLWSLIALTPNLPPPSELATRYEAFMNKVRILAEQDDLQGYLQGHKDDNLSQALLYLRNSAAATTELPQRTARLAALRADLVG